MTNNGFEIFFSYNSPGDLLSSVDDINTVFLADDTEKFSQLKKQIQPFLEDKSFSLAKRKETSALLNIMKKDVIYEDLFKMERIWRRYWELLVDHHISIKKGWLVFRTKDSKSISQPLLSSYFIPHQGSINPDILDFLPINIYSFCKHNDDPDWVPIIQTINRISKERTASVIGDRVELVSLIPAIETFLDITAQTDKTNFDTLVDLYAYHEWRASFRLKVQSATSTFPKSLCNKLSKMGVEADYSYGKILGHIRNCIIHPKNARKNGSGQYSEILTSSLMLQIFYAFASGLLIKGLLTYIGGLNPADLEKFTTQFINERCDYIPFKYE